MNFKNAKSDCFFDLKVFDFDSKAIASKCCEKNADADYDNSENDEKVPASLTASKKSKVFCAAHNFCDDNEDCIDTIEGIKCQCKAGFSLDQNAKCSDIDECKEDSHNCFKINKECVKLQGSFTCKQCLSGYEKIFAFDYYDENEDVTCVDVDECASDINKCPKSHQCENTDGGYNCIKNCSEGFQNINDECIDVDECQDKSLCQWKCKNRVGSYKCVCPSGYYLDESGNCMDIDECRNPNFNCGEKEVCINVNGGYRCKEINCPIGYLPMENST